MLNTKYNLFSFLPKLMTFIAFTFTTFSLILLLLNTSFMLEWTIIYMMSTPIKTTLYMDPTGLMYASIVSFISANVMLFSNSYMKNDPFINRFSILVLLFITSMNMLIFIPHFMILLLGWDGLGITSFILVIYYQNPKSLGAGMITAMTNRIGDVMILASIALTLNQGHWNILHMWESDFMWAQVVLIMVAASTKSAQMPFSSWLPAAMAAPTPVSALVHSSTLVTAGVFMLIRFHQFLFLIPWFKPTILLIAVCTMFMAGMSATTECDMKKIIALSTLSQLGVMMSALGLGAVYLASFHMMTHALFKALLFICAGELISHHHHTQELRWMGNLVNQMPIASTCMLLANLALCGIPFMAGFYSKDLILESMLTNQINLMMTTLSILATGFTMFYSIRFTTAIMWSPRTYMPMVHLFEPTMCTTPMLTMAATSIMGGAVILWLIPNQTMLPPLTIQSKLLPMMLTFFGMLLGLLLYMKHVKSPLLSKLPIFNQASCLMWFLVPLSTQLQLKPHMLISHQLTKSIDHAWLEMSSGQGMNLILSKSSTLLHQNSPKTPTNILMMSTSMMIIMLAISSM